MSSRPFCNKCDQYATLGGCNCDDPDFGAPIKKRPVVDVIEESESNVSFTWNEVKDATNRLYEAFFNRDIKDYVGQVAANALPSCITQVLAYCAVYAPTTQELKDDYMLLCQAYIQLEEEGRVGNGK